MVKVDYVSPSSVNRLLRCPRSWYLRYVLGVEEPSAVREAAALGTEVHEVIKRYYETLPGDIVPRLVDTHVMRAYAEYTRRHGIPEDRRRLVEQRLRCFAEFEKKRLGWGRRLRPYAVEKEYRVRPFKGIVDAVFVDTSGRAILVDWKTARGRTTATQEMVLQVNVYRWLFERAEKRRVSKAYLVFLDSCRVAGRVVYQEVPSMDVEGLARRVASILAKNRWEPVRGPHCRYCDTRLACAAMDSMESLTLSPRG